MMMMMVVVVVMVVMTMMLMVTMILTTMMMMIITITQSTMTRCHLFLSKIQNEEKIASFSIHQTSNSIMNDSVILYLTSISAYLTFHLNLYSFVLSVL